MWIFYYNFDCQWFFVRIERFKQAVYNNDLNTLRQNQITQKAQ